MELPNASFYVQNGWKEKKEKEEGSEKVMYQFNTGKPEPVNCPMSTKSKFSSMSKIELEEYGRTIGLELDRRLTKTKLIQKLEDHAKG